MTDTPTPGQICYEAWRRTEPRGWLYERPLPWAQLDASTHAAWEAAAQAVRAMQEEEKLCGSTPPPKP